jgi:hypothetical protein
MSKVTNLQEIKQLINFYMIMVTNPKVMGSGWCMTYRAHIFLPFWTDGQTDGAALAFSMYIWGLVGVADTGPCDQLASPKSVTIGS